MPGYGLLLQVLTSNWRPTCQICLCKTQKLCLCCEVVFLTPFASEVLLLVQLLFWPKLQRLNSFVLLARKLFNDWQEGRLNEAPEQCIGFCSCEESKEVGMRLRALQCSAIGSDRRTRPAC
eukprot:1937210-Amphidinium_carterae.1